MAVAMIVAVVLTACSGKASNSPAAGRSRDPVRISRPGFRNGPTIADPAALVSRPSRKPVSYRDRPVVQACSLVTVEDIRKTGLKVFPNSLPGAVERTYFDGQSQQDVIFPKYSLDQFDGNGCNYNLSLSGGHGGAVDVNVYQTSYASATAMDLEVSSGRSAAPISGVRVWTLPDRGGGADSTSYLLGDPKALVELRIDGPGKEDKQALLRTAAQRLATLSKHPTGPVRFLYDSPIFTGPFANGCELTDAATFRAVFHSDPSPLVTERVATAVAVGTIARNSSDEFNYVDHDCVRRSPAESPIESKSVSVRVKTFEQVAWAQKWFATDRSPTLAQGVTPVPKVGDEAFYAERRLDSNNGTLEFRKGRVLVVIGFSEPGGRGERSIGPASERIPVLTPVARTIAARLTGF